MVTSVQELISYHFLRRPVEEQLKIITDGPPRPSFALKKEIKECDALELLNASERSVYPMEMWLCGCAEHNAYFCWTCLLFVQTQKIWCAPSFLDVKELKPKINIHKKCADHFSGMQQYIIYQSKYLPASPKDIKDEEFSGENHEVLERIIDTVCTVVSQISSSYISTDYLDLQAQCLKLLYLVKTYDDQVVVNEACDFIQENPRAVLDIVDSLAILIKSEIKKELKLAPFVSIILNGHSEVGNILILSIVVRYVINGHVFERLVGFSAINICHSKISDFVQLLVDDLGISEKCLAISTDGVVLPKERLNEFLSWLQPWRPNTFFVPCHFHELHLMLQQTLSSVFPECDLFFKTLRSMRYFFESRPHVCKNIHALSDQSVLDLSNLKMSDSQFLRVLKQSRHDIIKFFGYITVDTRSIKESGFAMWLQDCQTVFLLELFYMLFAHTAFMNEMLTSNSPEGVFEYYVIDSTLDNLQSFKQYQFVKLCMHKNLDTQKSLGVKEVKERLSVLFENIVLHVIETIEARFKRTVNLGFLGILDFQNKEKFTVSDYHFKILSIMEYKFISIEQLTLELKVIGEHGWITGKKSVYEVVEFLHQKNLHKTFKNLYRLAEFIVSLPCKPVPTSSPCTKLDSINAWTSCLQIPESMSILSVESNCLEYLKSLTNFYHQVALELKRLSNKPK